MLKIITIFILLLISLGCTDARMETSTQCEEENGGYTNKCSIFVYQIKNGTLPIILAAPKVKNVTVEINAKVEKGSVELWLKDAYQQKTSIIIKSADHNVTLNGLAEVKESFVDEKPIFKIYIRPLGSFFNKQAQNISIHVRYRPDS